MTPHISGSMNDEVLRMGVYMYEEYSKFISGKPVNFEVTIEMLKTMA